MNDDLSPRLLDAKPVRLAKAALIAIAMLAPGLGGIVVCFATEAQPVATRTIILPPASAVLMSETSLLGRWELVGAATEGHLGPTLEFTSSGDLVARGSADEVQRTRYTATPIDDRSIAVAMRADAAQTVIDVTANRLVVHDPERGELVYRRI